MVSLLKKRGLPHLVRHLSPTTLGVWRIAGIVAGMNLTTNKRKAA
jgi:hypothetical protein